MLKPKKQSGKKLSMHRRERQKDMRLESIERTKIQKTQ